MKRWYQTSLVELLVASSVVAVFLSWNTLVRKEAVVYSYSHLTVQYEQSSVGWPYTFYRIAQPVNIMDAAPDLLVHRRRLTGIISSAEIH